MKMNEDDTTITISKKNRIKLEKLKVIPKEPINDVISRILKINVLEGNNVRKRK
jgi:hypothetical protein